MKCIIPEISWHNRDPVLSVHLQPKKPDEDFYRLASGGTDSHVLIWHVVKKSDGALQLDCVCDLTNHQKAVNVVKFSPDGKFLASADDESYIIIWKKREEADAPDLDTEDAQPTENLEQWTQHKVLRGHLNDIYDLSWSPDSTHLISGSVDNSCIVWDVVKGKREGILSDAKNFVQGVSWDPENKYLASISSDGKCRIYDCKGQKLLYSTGRCRPPGSKSEDKAIKLFHDDTLRTFFRRLDFSPDGLLLSVPSGLYEQEGSEEVRQNVSWLFAKRRINKCILYYPHGRDPSTVTRWCPVKFQLRPEEKRPVIDLPYKMVLALATKESIILYDTQCAAPIGLISNIHYSKLTDLTWSSDGTILIASSSDGYCSMVTFDDNELGEPFNKPATPEKTVSPAEIPNAKSADKSPLDEDPNSGKPHMSEEKEKPDDKQLVPIPE